MSHKTPANHEQYHNLWQDVLVNPTSWVLLAPNKFAQKEIEKTLLPVLQMTLHNKGVTKVELKATDNPDLFNTPAPGKKSGGATASFESNLNPDYRFENFVTAPSNNEAFAAAERVSGKTFFADSNPLFIYGGTGLELIDKKRQIILTCDRYPKEIEGLEARLKSRFGAGLTVSVRAPEPETRYAILKSKAKEQHFNLPDDVAFFIAENINSNVRDLEGALKKVIFQCQVIKGDTEATIAIAKAALHDQLQIQKNQSNVDNIQKVVAQYHSISIGDLLSASRRKNLADPRMMAMALTRELTDMSLKSIAESFHRKDHSTVLNAIENVEERRKNDLRFREEYETVKAIITG